MAEDRLIAALQRFPQLRAMTLGDLMLDRFVYGTVDRISPEAPIPVLRIEREAPALGGAGNVARNVAALGAEAILVGALGDDAAGHALASLAGETPRLSAEAVIVPGRATTTKTRFVGAGQQLLRVDWETAAPLDEAATRRIGEVFQAALGQVQAVLLSDYAKGVLGEAVVAGALAAAKAAGVPVLVDPKARDFRRYAGADVLTPNAKELALAAGRPTGTDAEVEEAADAILQSVAIGALVVTRSEKGMSVFVRGAAPVHVRATAREVFDVSGAGDTVLATLGLGLAAGLTLADAAALANEAAGLAVAKAGTAAVHAHELEAALHAKDVGSAEAKVVTAAQAAEQAEAWRRRGLKVGFTNGCFDLIHPGHVALLADARAACDRLIVGLNTDASVRRLKGAERPVNAEMARAIVLASLASVDRVTLFGEDTPMALIEAIRPDVLIKGADYTVETVVGAPFVQAYGGRVHLVPLRAGHSTTSTIARMKAAP